MKVRTRFLIFTILISLFLVIFFHNESFAVPNYGTPGSYETAFSIELVCDSAEEEYEIEISGDYGYETRVYSEKILEEDFYVKIASLVDMGETIETNSFGVLNYIGTEEIIGRHCYIYTVDITDKTIFDNKIIEDLRYPEYDFKFYYEISIKETVNISDLNINIDTKNKYYTGEEIKTSISIKDGEYVLEEGTDYTVEYKDNTNIGTATVTIVGIGNYGGTINKTFKIISENTDYKYTILNDGTIEINEYIGYDKEIVEIPNKIDGYKVTKIGDNAFVNEYLNSSETEIISNNRQHIKIIIPEGVISIGEDTFKACDKLVEVDLPATLLSIGTNAFQNCTSLKEIIIPDSTTLIGIGAFRGNSSLERIVLSKNITEINDSTFAYCTNLSEIIIPEKVQSINEMAFYKCTSIQKMEIPKSVTKIEWEAFGDCSALKEIEFKETTTIEIQIGAFYNCTNLIKVVLPKTITNIKDNNIFEGASSQLIVYVEKDSYAQQFCIDNNYNYFIQQKELKDLLIEISDVKVYTGNFTRTEIFIKDGEYTLKENIDYKTEYKDNINVGTASLTIIGIGNYTGTVDKQFEIEQQSISSVSGIPLYGGKTYTGQEIKLDLIVKGHNDSILVENQDYKVEYSNNINVGTAHFKVIGIGNYKGLETGSFSIVRKYLNELEDVSIDTSDKVYKNTPEGIVTTIKIKYNDRELKENEDYTIRYKENNKVGIAWVYIDGIGNYMGSITRSYNILPEDIQNLKISVDNISTIYTGKEIQPKIEIKGLTAWEDYTLNYENCVNVGTMTITITGITNYTGTVTKKVEILPKNIQDIPITVCNSIYNGKEQRNIVLLNGLVQGIDYTEVYKNNINVGVATVILTGVGNYTGTITKNFKIEPMNIPSELITIDTSNKTYSGQEIKPTVSVKNLTKGIDYTVTYQNNINVGKAKIIITGIGNYTGTKEHSFEIKKANISNSSTNYEGIYDGKEHSINVKVDIPNYDIKYSVNNNNYNLNTIPSFKDVGDYTINYKITSPNYNDLIGSNKVRIYGVKKLDSTLEIRNNMLIVKNYKNNFTDLCNRIQLHANSKSYLHLNQNKNVINDLLVKTGEYIQLVINNSTKLEYKVSVLADVNGDGKISALDYVKIKNHIMKTNLINTDVYLTAADVNDDGKISALDYVRIKNYIMNGGV